MKSVELKLVILLLSATPVLAAPPGSDARRQKIESDWLIDEAVRADDKRVTNLTTREDAAGGCDGVKDGSYGFHTGKAKEPWWQVDVGERVSIARVVIWNRGEATERAAKLSVRFSDDAKEWATVYTHDGTKFLGFTDGKPLEVKLAAQAARYVRIQLSDEEFLHLDEVEVFGPEAPARNLALHRPADQVSISQWSTDHRPPPEPDWRKRAVEVLAHCERLVGELRETGDDSYATAKESKRKNSQRAVPLTPALSPSAGEREKVSQARINRKRPSSAKTPPAILPLPTGEGRGEGKGISRTPSLSSLESKLTSLTSRLASLPTDHSARPLFLEARWFQRTLALANPHLRGFDAILFTTRVPPSFNHMSDQYYGWWSKPGGGIYVLRDFTSDTPTTDCLTDAFKEPGNFLRPTLSYDGAKVLFAWCKHYSTLANEKDKLNKANVPGDAFYYLFEMNLDGSGVRQLTHGKYDDFDGRYLPDGRIVFLSTRRGQLLQVGHDTALQTCTKQDLPDSYVRCGGGPERPVAVYTLHTMNSDGTGLTAISPFEMFEWTPEVAHDGSILYSRWDYIDRDNMPYMGLWAISPEGQNARIVYGNFTKSPHCAFEPKPIPGSPKIIFTASAHHQQTMGSLVLLDPSAGTEGAAPITRLTPEVPFPEIEGWPKTYYANPWPLSERHHLVAWGHEGITVPGPAGWDRWHAVQRPKNGMALYFFDAAGGKDLLYFDPEISCGDPIPVRPRSRPATLAQHVNWDGPKEGRFLLSDVYRGLKTVKRGDIKSLRIVAVPPKTHPTMNFPSMGVTHDDPGKLVLGTVPVEEDGSAYFRAPAGVIVFFQALDAQGRAVQTMRSATHVQPGQTLSCIGCHEDRDQAPPQKVALAALRAPSKIRVGPEGSWPLRFDHLVQPVLDRQCISCHNPKASDEKAAKRDLTPENSYDSLIRYGKPSLSEVVLTGYRRGYSVEGEGPALGSALLNLLDAPARHYEVKLSTDDRERLLTWMDTYAQKSGAFSAEQEARLEELRSACASLLEEQAPKQTAAASQK